MLKRSFLFLSILLIAQSCLALQSISIKDNEMRRVQISSYELSRIFVKGDRIQNVRGMEGAYILTKDPVQGQIYVKPTPIYQHKPFNLFLTTEQGHNYNLFVTSFGLAGQDIELKPASPTKAATTWEKNSVYSQLMVKLIGAMTKNEPLDGYAVLFPDKKTNKSIRFGQLELQLYKIYRGDHLRGEILQVKNCSHNSIEISEAQLYQSDTRALALLNTQLPPHGKTILYRVLSND